MPRRRGPIKTLSSVGPKTQGPSSPPEGPFSETLLRYPWAWSLGLTALLFLYLDSHFVPYFQRSGDVFRWMSLRGEGIAAAPTVYFPHLGYLGALLLSTLTRWFPSIPWYGAGIIGLLFGAVWAAMASLFLAGRSTLNLFFFLLFFFSIFPYFFAQLSSTTAAEMAVLASLFLLRAALPREKDRIPGALLALVLLIISAWVSLEGFLVAVLAALPYAVLAFRDPTAGKELRAQGFWILAAWTLLVGGGNLWGGWASPEWRPYLEWDSLRHELQDVRTPVYDPGTRPVFESLGWTPNDLALFQEVAPFLKDMGDLRKLIPLFPRWGTPKRASILSWIDIFNSRKSRILVFCFLVFILFVTRPDLPVVGASLVWVLGLLWIRVQWFPCPEDLFLPLMAFLVLLALFHARTGPESGMDPVRHRKQRLVRSFLLVPCTLMMFDTFHFYYGFDDFVGKRSADLAQTLTRLDPREDQLFLIGDPRFPYPLQPALGGPDLFSSMRLLPLGPLERSPFGNAWKDSFHIQGDLLKALVGRQDLFFIGTSRQAALVRGYLDEKFGTRTSLREYFNAPLPPWGLVVYRLQSP